MKSLSVGRLVVGVAVVLLGAGVLAQARVPRPLRKAVAAVDDAQGRADACPAGCAWRPSTSTPRRPWDRRWPMTREAAR